MGKKNSWMALLMTAMLGVESFAGAAIAPSALTLKPTKKAVSLKGFNDGFPRGYLMIEFKNGDYAALLVPEVDFDHNRQHAIGIFEKRVREMERERKKSIKKLILKPNGKGVDVLPSRENSFQDIGIIRNEITRLAEGFRISDSNKLRKQFQKSVIFALQNFFVDFTPSEKEGLKILVEDVTPLVGQEAEFSKRMRNSDRVELKQNVLSKMIETIVPSSDEKEKNQLQEMIGKALTSPDQVKNIRNFLEMIRDFYRDLMLLHQNPAAQCLRNPALCDAMEVNLLKWLKKNKTVFLERQLAMVRVIRKNKDHLNESPEIQGVKKKIASDQKVLLENLKKKTTAFKKCLIEVYEKKDHSSQMPPHRPLKPELPSQENERSYYPKVQS